MRIPNYLKKVRCDICGELCIKMTYGIHYFDKESGKFFDVAVCYDCDQLLGESAYSEACKKRIGKLDVTSGISILRT